MSILATTPDLTKIIKKAVERIGENHALARDNKGVEMSAKEVENDRKEFRKNKLIEGESKVTQVIEESLKAAADEMAEKMVLENTIDKMIKEFIIDSNKDEKGDTTAPVSGKEINESTYNAIKKIVSKKLKDKINEAKGPKIPGYEAYEKAVKKSKKETDTYHKDTKKKFKKYDSFEGGENPEFPHQESSQTNSDGQYQYYRNNKEDEEFIEDFGYPGLLDFDIHNVDMKRLAQYLEGSSETGNAQTDEDGKDLGNVVSSDLGKKMMKSSERRKEKIAAQKASMTNLRGYTPDVQKVKQVKEDVITDIDNMKKLWDYNKITQ